MFGVITQNKNKIVIIYLSKFDTGAYGYEYIILLQIKERLVSLNRGKSSILIITTTSHNLALRRIMEGAKAKNLKATMVFIDFIKAFDSVHRG